jgi:SAM-dependent methyltransferase
MDIISLNRGAWESIGENIASPYLNYEKYALLLQRFCDSLPMNGTVLDLGCGPGLPFTGYLVQKGFHVTGIDFAESMLISARRNVPEATYICMSMTEISYSNNFDGIFCGHSMLCLDPENFKVTARKIAKALRPDGWIFLALNEPPPPPLYEEESCLTEILGRRMYSRPYSEAEVRTAFPESLDVMAVERETVSTNEYGEEFVLLVLLRKVRG